MLASLRCYRFSLRLRSAVAGVTRRDGLFVVVGEGAQTGIGEVAVWPSFDGVSIEDVLAALHAWDGTTDARNKLPRALLWALECASRPFARSRVAVRSAVLIAPDDDAPFDARLREATVRRAPAVKLKVGRGARDIEHIARLRSALPTTELRLDANRALDVEAAYRLHEACRDFDVAYFEEPCATLADLAELARRGVKLALDESLLDAVRESSDAVREGSDAVREGSLELLEVFPTPEAFVIKPSLLGPSGLQEIVEFAQRRGVPCIVSSTFESRLGREALAEVAARIAPAAIHGLGTADFFAEDFDTDALQTANDIDAWLDALQAAGRITHPPRW